MTTSRIRIAVGGEAAVRGEAPRLVTVRIRVLAVDDSPAVRGVAALRGERRAGS